METENPFMNLEGIVRNVVTNSQRKDVNFDVETPSGDIRHCYILLTEFRVNNDEYVQMDVRKNIIHGEEGEISENYRVGRMRIYQGAILGGRTLLHRFIARLDGYNGDPSNYL